MTTENINLLKWYVEEFYKYLRSPKGVEHHVLQAKELQSIQNAIKAEMKKIEEIKDEDLKKEVEYIIGIDDAWWCFE